MPGRIQTVFFDAAGTLFRVRGSVSEVYGHVAQRFGFELDDGGARLHALEENFRSAFRKHEPMLFRAAKAGDSQPIALDRLKLLERDWWLGVVRETFESFAPFPRLEEFFDEVFRLFGTAEAWRLEEGCVDALDEIKRQGFALGVISNFDSRLEGLLKSLGIRSFFKTVTISSVCGFAKPDPGIFNAALAELGCEAGRALHVGDDWEDDLEGAKAVGMQAVLYDPGRRAAPLADRVESLSGVLEFLV